MDSTLSRLFALIATLVPLAGAALNHDVVVAPLSPGPFAVACSNMELDTARLAQLGGTPADYWEGHEVNSQVRYVTDILAHPESAIVFQAQVPFKFWLYPTRFGQRVEFAAIVCHPTPRANTDASYTLPDGGGVVPHMLPAGSAPKLISALEYAQTLGIQVDPPPPGPAALPYIVYSHGLGGSPLGKGYLDVMVELAAQGFMVAAVFHADARFSLVRIEDLGDLAYTLAFFPFVVEMQLMRPVALKAMTDVMLDHPGYSPGIDRDRIGGFGASLGGEAMAHLLGARITSSLARSCDESVRDPRIRAAVGYVPYAGQSFLPAFCDGQSGAAEVNRPYLAISGTADTTAPIKMTQQAVNLFGDSRYLVQLVGGQHELRPEDAGDLLTWMVTYFNAYLHVAADPGAMARFIKMNGVQGGRDDSLIVDVHVPFANVGTETTAKEFYNTILGHYFVAAAQSEVDGILAGAAGPAWELTGQSFKVWPQLPADASFGAVPVCRFYGGRNGGPNSHFFTAEASECELVKNSPGWLYEGIGFYIRPVGAGRCPSGYLEVNRAYNKRASQNDTNHRFSTSDSTMKEMARLNWIVEGTVMCARP
ncbi:MAG: alpha/beta hydrolase [Usitatibacter sp.]